MNQLYLAQSNTVELHAFYDIRCIREGAILFSFYFHLPDVKYWVEGKLCDIFS